MSIPTQMSLVGFIVATPERHSTEGRNDFVRVRIGVEHWGKEANGDYTPLEPTYHDMVAYAAAADRIRTRFRKGDSFIASGYIHEYEVEQPGGSVIKEEFVARKIGHNANHTSYTVERGRHAAPAHPSPTVPAVRHQPAVGM